MRFSRSLSLSVSPMTTLSLSASQFPLVPSVVGGVVIGTGGGVIGATMTVTEKETIGGEVTAGAITGEVDGVAAVGEAAGATTAIGIGAVVIIGSAKASRL